MSADALKDDLREALRREWALRTRLRKLATVAREFEKDLSEFCDCPEREELRREVSAVLDTAQ